MPHSRLLQRNELEDHCEFYYEDSVRLRQLAQEQAPAEALGGWQRRRQSKMAQLETLNAELERMISDMEEERRRTRSSQMLCARYHGMYDPVDCNLKRTLSACFPLQSTCCYSTLCHLEHHSM
jgi:transcription initiation factor TFIIIB Brf1 subunit/transcription initiation factor TFIIB